MRSLVLPHGAVSTGVGGGLYQLLGFVDLRGVGGGAGPILEVAAAWGWTVVLLVSVFLGPGRQGLHDRAAGTFVVTT